MTRWQRRFRLGLGLFIVGLAVTLVVSLRRPTARRPPPILIPAQRPERRRREHLRPVGARARREAGHHGRALRHDGAVRGRPDAAHRRAVQGPAARGRRLRRSRRRAPTWSASRRTSTSGSKGDVEIAVQRRPGACGPRRRRTTNGRGRRARARRRAVRAGGMSGHGRRHDLRQERATCCRCSTGRHPQRRRRERRGRRSTSKPARRAWRAATRYMRFERGVKTRAPAARRSQADEATAPT